MFVEGPEACTIPPSSWLTPLERRLRLHDSRLPQMIHAMRDDDTGDPAPRLDSLRRRLEERSATLAVLGLGHVGLPVACAFADAGFRVLGVDVREDYVAELSAGHAGLAEREPGLADLLAEVVASGRLRVTTEHAAAAGDADVVLICVPTPVEDNHAPDHRPLLAALDGIGPALRDGTLVIVESTVAPGTTRELVRPRLERASGLRVGVHLFLGVCPERVMPGELLAKLRSRPRVLGEATPGTADVMAALYRHVVQGELEATDATTAEIVKVTENAHRDVQVAFINEIALA